MKTKSVTAEKNEDSFQIIKVNSIKEAKEKIYYDLQNKINFRDIVKNRFDINGKIKSFNIAQINQIKAEFEPKIEPDILDSKKAEVFRLLQKGFSPIDVIIKTKLSYDFVTQSWNEYLALDDKQVISKKYLSHLKRILKPLGIREDDSNYWEILTKIQSLVDEWQKPNGFFYNCRGCGKPIKIQQESLNVAKKYLSKNYGHSKCIPNPRLFSYYN